MKDSGSMDKTGFLYNLDNQAGKAKNYALIENLSDYASFAIRINFAYACGFNYLEESIGSFIQKVNPIIVIEQHETGVDAILEHNEKRYYCKADLYKNDDGKWAVVSLSARFPIEDDTLIDKIYKSLHKDHLCNLDGYILHLN